MCALVTGVQTCALPIGPDLSQTASAAIACRTVTSATISDGPLTGLGKGFRNCSTRVSVSVTEWLFWCPNSCAGTPFQTATSTRPERRGLRQSRTMRQKQRHTLCCLSLEGGRAGGGEGGG